MPRAVSDSSVLIHLGATGRLDLLPAAFSEVIVPTEVWREVVFQTAAFTSIRDSWRESSRKPANDLLTQWVRERPCGHPLPVVAIGSIPYIYRRVGFQLRATPVGGAVPRRRLRFWTE